jgi:hypothetical protein
LRRRDASPRGAHMPVGRTAPALAALLLLSCAPKRTAPPADFHIRCMVESNGRWPEYSRCLSDHRKQGWRR